MWTAAAWTPKLLTPPTVAWTTQSPFRYIVVWTSKLFGTHKISSPELSSSSTTNSFHLLRPPTAETMFNFFKNVFSQTEKSQHDGTPPPKNGDGTLPQNKDASPHDSKKPPPKQRVNEVSPARGGNSEDDSERQPAVASNNTSTSADGMDSFYANVAKEATKKAKKRKSRTKDSAGRAPTARAPVQKDDFEWKDPESFTPPEDTDASGPPAKKQRVEHVFVYKRGDPCDNEIQCKNCNLLFGYLSDDDLSEPEPDEIRCTKCKFFCHNGCMASSKICEHCYKNN